MSLKKPYFDQITKLEDFDIHDTSVDKMPHENILAYDIPYRTLIGTKPLRFYQMDLLESMMEVDIQYYLALKFMMPSFHFYEKAKVDSFYYLLIQKKLALYNVTVHIQSTTIKSLLL